MASAFDILGFSPLQDADEETQPEIEPTGPRRMTAFDVLFGGKQEEPQTIPDPALGTRTVHPPPAGSITPEEMALEEPSLAGTVLDPSNLLTGGLSGLTRSLVTKGATKAAIPAAIREAIAFQTVGVSETGPLVKGIARGLNPEKLLPTVAKGSRLIPGTSKVARPVSVLEQEELLRLSSATSEKALFRGGKAFDPSLVTDEGVSLTLDPSIAKTFARGEALGQGKFAKGTGVLEEFRLVKNARIANREEIRQRFLAKNPGHSDTVLQDDLAAFAKKEGFDAIDFSGTEDLEIRVLNVKALIKKAAPVSPRAPLPSEETTFRRLFGTPEDEAAHLATLAKGETIKELTSRTALFKGLAQESTRTISGFGPAGRKLATDTRQMLVNQEIEAAGFVEAMKKTVSKLDKKELDNLIDVLEQVDTPINSKVAQAATEEAARLRTVGSRAFQSGLDILNPITKERIPFTPREAFFPHFSTRSFEEIAKDPRRVAKIIEEIQQKALAGGKQITLAEARTTFDFMRKNSRTRFGNLEVARTFNVQDYDRDYVRVLTRYYDGAVPRLVEAETFGADGRRANELVAIIRQQAEDRAGNFAQTYVDRLLGKENLNIVQELAKQAGPTIKSIQAATKLGQAVIPNLSQSTLTAITVGAKPTMKALRASFTGQGKEFASRTGVLLDSSMQRLMQELGGSGLGQKVLKATGFSAVERANRIIGANAGKFFVQDVFAKLLANPASRRAGEYRHALSKMGVSADTVLKRGFLVEDDLLRAGQYVVNRTQFKANVADLPLFWTSPLGQIATQFKSFAFKSGQLIKDEVAGQAIRWVRTGGKRGSLGPLTRMMLIGLPVGFGVAGVSSLVRGKPEVPGPIDSIAAIGALGIYINAVKAAQFGEVGVFSLAGGPTASDIATTVSGLSEAAQGRPKKLAKFATREIPIVGPTAANILFPPRGR